MYVIYDIECAVNGKHYIGYTSKSGAERFAMHLDNARWKRKVALYDAMRTYGPENFSVTEIAVCKNHADGCFVEAAIIADRKTILPHGYNMTHGGDGVPMTPEVREKSNAKKRGRCTQKQREHADRMRGRKQSQEHIEKCRLLRIGKKHSAEWCENISKGLTGKKRKPWSLRHRLIHALSIEARRQGIPVE